MAVKLHHVLHVELLLLLIGELLLACPPLPSLKAFWVDDTPSSLHHYICKRVSLFYEIVLKARTPEECWVKIRLKHLIQILEEVLTWHSERMRLKKLFQSKINTMLVVLDI
jgi:hypothetical protein